MVFGSSFRRSSVAIGSLPYLYFEWLKHQLLPHELRFSCDVWTLVPTEAQDLSHTGPHRNNVRKTVSGTSYLLSASILLLPVSFHHCFIVIFDSSAIDPNLTSRRAGSGCAWVLNSRMEINFAFQWKWAENITINKRGFAVISSHRECRTMCNIRKNCYPLILTGSILQDTISWSRNCRFYEIPSPVVTFAEAIH